MLFTERMDSVQSVLNDGCGGGAGSTADRRDRVRGQLHVVTCAGVGPCKSNARDFRPKQLVLGKLGCDPIRVADYYTPTVCGKQEVWVP